MHRTLVSPNHPSNYRSATDTPDTSIGRRTRHLIDVDNLLGDPGCAEGAPIRGLFDAYRQASSFNHGDQVVVATAAPHGTCWQSSSLGPMYATVVEQGATEPTCPARGVGMGRRRGPVQSGGGRQRRRNLPECDGPPPSSRHLGRFRRSPSQSRRVHRGQAGGCIRYLPESA